MYIKKNFNNTRRAFNRSKNAQGRENENQGAKRGLPRNIAPIVHVLKTNKDVRTYCSKVLINLHRHNGDIEDGQKVFVEFNNGVYSIIKYPKTEDGIKSMPIRNDYPYTTKEFYLALQASAMILLNVIVNNFANYFVTYKPAFDLKDTNLDKIFEGQVKKVSDSEIAFQNNLLSEGVEEVAQETENDNAE